jgi:hypothetical protein
VCAGRSIFNDPYTHGSKCYLEVEHVRVKLDHIHLRRIELNSVLCFSHSILIIETLYKGFVITTVLCKVIQTLCIVDPQSNIPGLIVVPPIVTDIKGIELIGCGGHLGLGSAHTIETLYKAPFVRIRVSNMKLWKTSFPQVIS